ncbi:MAG: hypothetical protein R2909_19820 [Gemmatimonadales bacterium]
MRPFARRVNAASLLALSVVLASCSDDLPTEDRGGPDLQTDRAATGSVAVCHHPDAAGRILTIARSALAAHLAHGDYVTTLRVGFAGDMQGVDFATVTDALDAIRTDRLARGESVEAACRITVLVAAGTITGTTVVPAPPGAERFPLLVDVPDVTLRGALAMGLDRNGRATGQGTGEPPTVLTPAEPLPVVAGASTPIVLVNGHPGGSAGNGFVLEGFVLQSGHDPAVSAGGQGILTVRAGNVVIRGNRFEAGFTESIDVRGGGAQVIENHLAGTAGTCDVCLAGPGHFRARGNLLLAGGIPGITVDGVVGLPVPAGVEPFDLPSEAEMWVEVINNEVRDHLRTPVGVGIRVDALGVGAPNVFNRIHAVIRNNLLVDNRFGLIVHAAFPVANTGLHSNLDVTLGGNRIEGSCQAKLLVSLSRHTTALGLSNNPWLKGSTFELRLNGDLQWDEAWYGHAAGFGNTLIVDGQQIAEGGYHAYSATTCPGA